MSLRSTPLEGGAWIAILLALVAGGSARDVGLATWSSKEEDVATVQTA